MSKLTRVCRNLFINPFQGSPSSHAVNETRFLCFFTSAKYDLYFCFNFLSGVPRRLCVYIDLVVILAHSLLLCRLPEHTKTFCCMDFSFFCAATRTCIRLTRAKQSFLFTLKIQSHKHQAGKWQSGWLFIHHQNGIVLLVFKSQPVYREVALYSSVLLLVQILESDVELTLTAQRRTRALTMRTQKNEKHLKTTYFGRSKCVASGSQVMFPTLLVPQDTHFCYSLLIRVKLKSPDVPKLTNILKFQ